MSNNVDVIFARHQVLVEANLQVGWVIPNLDSILKTLVTPEILPLLEEYIQAVKELNNEF